MKIALGLLVAGTLLSGAGAVRTSGQKAPLKVTREGPEVSDKGLKGDSAVAARAAQTSFAAHQRSTVRLTDDGQKQQFTR